MEPAEQREAIVAVVVRRGRLLVVQRGPAVPRPGFWTPPSGRVEPGEAQPETVVRELREELSLAVRAGAKVWECDTDDRAYRLYWWTAELVDDRLSEWALAPDEISDARWVTPAEFDRLVPTFADDRKFVREILPTLGLLAHT